MYLKYRSLRCHSVTQQNLPAHDRAIAYDREICIEICRQLILRKELREICSKPPMPPGQAFLCWVQDHKEAREIYRSAQNFRSDRSLAKELGVSLAVSVSEWEEELRANIELGWPADWVERKYIPPDWKKVFPLIGGPPVGSSENMQAYTELLNAYTEMLEPRDLMELGWIKEATDAAWESQGVTALDYGALRARSKNYQRVDRTRVRAISRRDNALRQIAIWRKGLGAKPRRLPDHLVVEHLLARRYGVEQLPAEAETDAISVGTAEPSALVAPASEAAKPARAFAPQKTEDADAGLPFALAADAAQSASPLGAPGDADTSTRVDGVVAAPVYSTDKTTTAGDPPHGRGCLPIRLGEKSAVVESMKYNLNGEVWQNEPKASLPPTVNASCPACAPVEAAVNFSAMLSPARLCCATLYARPPQTASRGSSAWRMLRRRT